MRRIATALLLFFGIAFITAAIVIPTYLIPKLKVVPLDLDITSLSTTVSPDDAPGDRFPARMFDRCSINEDHARVLDAHLTQQRRSVIIDPSDENQATLQSAQTVRIDRYRDEDGNEVEPTMGDANAERTCKDALLTSSIDRISVDRKTSAPNNNINMIQLEAIPDGGTVEEVSVGTGTDVEIGEREGFQYKFPFNTGKGEYPYYDLNTRQDTIAEFVQEVEIDGHTVYEFVTEVPETDISELPNPQGDAALGTILNMPASWWGITGDGVKADCRITMHRYASATRHVFVDPVTGTIVSGREDQHQYFRSPGQSEDCAYNRNGTERASIADFRMDAMKATYQWSDETVQMQTDRAQHYNRLLNLGGFWAPLVLGIVGGLMVLAWLFLLLRARRGGGATPAVADGGGPVDSGPGNGGPGDAGPVADSGPPSGLPEHPEWAPVPHTFTDPAPAVPAYLDPYAADRHAPDPYSTDPYSADTGIIPAVAIGAAGYAPPEAEYTAPEYLEAEYTEVEYTEPGHTDAGHAEAAHTDVEYTEAAYSEAEYTEPAYFAVPELPAVPDLPAAPDLPAPAAVDPLDLTVPFEVVHPDAAPPAPPAGPVDPLSSTTVLPPVDGDYWEELDPLPLFEEVTVSFESHPEDGPGESGHGNSGHGRHSR